MSGDKSSSSVPKRLVEFARQNYRFSQSEEKDAFAVPLKGPNLALFLSEGERAGYKSRLARDFYAATGVLPSKTQLGDAFNVLLADCADAPPEPCYRRVAPAPSGGIVVDLGGAEGKVVVVSPDEPAVWHIAPQSPVLFSRTALVGPMPDPVAGGCVDEIQRLFGLTDRQWALLLGWVIATFDRDLPHPILAICGPAGAGKSCLARLLVQLCDPSPCPLRSAPDSEKDWHIAASNSWVYAIDNLSDMPTWLSEALCKAATGDARVVRALYTDKTLAVTTLKIPVILTSIEPGTIRGDFGDRLVMLELPRRDRSMTERDMERFISARRPAWLGDALAALAKTLASRSRATPTTQSARMADFMHLLRCADESGVTVDAYGAYRENRRDTAREVGDGDELVAAITKMLQGGPDPRWNGTASELLRALNASQGNEKPPGWPKGANVLSARLKRLEPVLRDCGVRYERSQTSPARTWLITLSLSEKIEPSLVSLAAEPEDTFPAEIDIFFANDPPPPERSPNDIERPPTPLPSDPRAIAERSLQDRRMMADHDRAPRRANPVAASLDAYNTCRRCGSRKVVDEPIHGGKSLRRACADCQAFIAFPQWNP
jgi:hypothetical protein